MTREESIMWLEHLHTAMGENQYQGLWHYEQALAETIELLQSDRLVELPCNIGDYVYYVYYNSNYNRIPKKAKVISFGVNENGTFDVELEDEWSTFVLPINEVFFNISCVEKYLKELNK